MKLVNNIEFKENLLGVSLLIGLFLPHNSYALMAIMPVLYIFIKYINRKDIYTANFKYLFISAIIISFFLNVLHVNGIKPMFESLNIFLLFLMFPLVGNIKLKNKYIYVSLVIIFLSQIVYIFNFQPIISIIDSLYPISEMDENYMSNLVNTIDINNALDFRLGGIFRNSNHCARYTTFMLAIFLIENKFSSVKNIILPLIIFSISILITGSRTGFFIMSLMIMYYIYQSKKIKKINKYIIISLSFILFIIILILGSEKFRAFNVAEGFNNSANAKWDTFIYHLTNESSPLKYLFGYLDSTRYNPAGNVMKAFDSEYGYLFFNYGLFGFMSVLIFYLSVFLSYNKYTRLFFIILLWCVSSTILLSFRMSFLFMLFLSKYYCESREIKNNKTNNNYVNIQR